MNTLVALFACSIILLLLFPLFLYQVGFFEQNREHRLLIDPFKTIPKSYSRAELRHLRQGSFVDLGVDMTTHQMVPLPESARLMNVINLGPTGAGKSTYFMSTFLSTDIADRANCVVIFDGQKDITEQIIPLCQQHGRTLHIYPDIGFNPLAGPGDASSRAALFADLFSQVAESGEESAALYYSRQAQLFIRKTMPLYEKAYKQPMILRELLTLCVSEQRREQLIADAGVCPESADFDLFFGSWKGQKKYDENLAGLVTFIDRLTVGERNDLYNRRNAPTLADLIEERSVILIREGGYRNTQDRTTGLLFMIALQDYVTRRESMVEHPDSTITPHLLAVYLDEAHMYFNNNYPSFISQSRKKRVAQHLGFQSFAQFEPFAEIITTNARTWAIHGGLLNEDATIIADNIGMREFKVTSRSQHTMHPATSEQMQESVIYDYLVHPHHVRGLVANTLLLMSVEGREIQSHRFLRKPDPLIIPRVAYSPPQSNNYAPPTIWEEQDVAGMAQGSAHPDASTTPETW